LLSTFGPLSILMLITLWAVTLVFSFALVQWAVETSLNTPDGVTRTFGTYLYMSGATFFTLGYGDVTARTSAGQTIAIFEAGLGFVFLAVVIGYLPVLYGAFSRREMALLHKQLRRRQCWYL